MLFTTHWLAELFPTKNNLVISSPIEQITTDSRTKSTNALFAPLKGESFDGHDFIESAYKNGAVATIWDKEKKVPSFLPDDFPIFLVDDSLLALQKLASAYRNLINPTVIGVTGSNGKTTTKDLIGTVMKTHYRTHQTKGNFNNHIGLPLTILSMPVNTEVLVLEMGMNHFGEIEQLSKIAKPDYGVITNIGESHIEFLGSREGIAKAKSEILSGMDENGVLVIDGDEPLLSELHQKENVICCGFNNKNDVHLKHFSMTESHSSFFIDNETYRLNMLGEHNVKNASFAITIANKLSIPVDKVKQALVHTELTGMRFEIVKGLNDSTIINDAYNASPTSMKASIEVVKHMDAYETKVLVLGDIFEMGNHSKEMHRKIGEAITGDIDVVFTLGKDANEISEAIREKGQTIIAKHFSSKEHLLEALTPYLNKETVILLKASRGMKFETLLEGIVNN